MSLGTWDPTAGSASSDLQLTPELLGRLVAFSAQDQLNELGALLENDDEQLSRLMQVGPALWQDAAGELDNESLLHLIRFFAVVENLPGWEAGATSPVIPLARMLRQRGARLDKPFLQWLREVNENRYLPYGPL